jgi:hypothetical protein
MSRHVRVLYEWQGQPGHEHLERKGWISEARLRAWEYRQDSRNGWTYDAENFHDTVRPWKTTRADLRVPEELLVGDYEERRLD